MKSKFAILFLVSFFAFSACQDKKKGEAINSVKEWMGKEILFPKSSVFTVRGSDTIDFSLDASDYNLKADKSGFFNKSLKVYCNIEESPIWLVVKGVTE